jgi:hypothetical protein
LIALVTTYFLVFYILIPGAVFRFASSLFVRLKLFQRTRTQEATFAVAVALVPFALALAGVWYAPFLRDHPFPIQEGTFAQRRQDYRRVASILTSSDASRQLGSPAPDNATAGKPVNTAAANSTANWAALNRVLRRQARFLSWYFAFLAAEGMAFGFLASKYGDWQEITGTGPRAAFVRAYLWIGRKFILPNISEWHMLLTSFNVPRKNKLFVAADILQSDGNLYKGRVADYFIDGDGKLTGILMKDVYRFDRHDFDQAKEIASAKAGGPTFVNSDPFWRVIPSANFYIGQSSISNLNLRFAPREDETLRTLTVDALRDGDFSPYDVSVSSEATEGSPGAGPRQPDVYS